MLFAEDYEDDAPKPSITRAVLIWLLVVVTIIVCALALPAHAQVMTFEDPLGNSVQLFDTPCYEAPPWLGFRKASMLYQGKSYEACWTLVGHTVLLIDSAGDSTPIPMDVFKKASYW